jgi:pimeloyl-ACP methyl ester carboxylesterase
MSAPLARRSFLAGASFCAAGAAARLPEASPVSRDRTVERGYTRCRYGQLHFRRSGAAKSKPALVLLHQIPSTSLDYEPLITAMASDRVVVAFDTPGYGMSDPPPQPLSMADYAAAVVDGIDALGLAAARPVDIFGAALARPGQVGRLVLSGVPMRTAEERASRLAGARAVQAPTDDGEASLAFLRSMWAYIVTNRDPGVPIDRAVRLFVDRSASLDRYAWAYQGVWSYPAEARLPLLRQPTLILQPRDELFEASQRAAPFIANSQFVELDGPTRDIFEVSTGRVTQALRRFLT